MWTAMTEKRVLGLLADILDYPRPGLAERILECETLLSESTPGAADLLGRFRSFVEATPLGILEEVYTGYFDLNSVCHPYIGYHVFGESYKRSAFLLTLKEMYRSQGFQADEVELPDRLSVVLRFLAMSKDEQSARETLAEGVLPALEQMTKEEGTASLPATTLDMATPQLEGHSQGEVLAGGFVLEMTEVAGIKVGVQSEEYPYRQALRALRAVVEAICQPQVSEQGAHPSGGKNHG